MDGRDPITPGASQYYINMGLGSSGGGGPPYGLHGVPGMRQMSNTNPPGGSFHLDPAGSVMPMSMPVNVGSGGSSGTVQSEPVKRKRGRPRKYGPDGSVALALSPLSSLAPASVSGTGSTTPRRGRGRPPGTGRRQQLASLGEWVAGSAGMGFTPHIITIGVGEDIATKIMSFSQQGPRAVCILSANGAVSRVTLRQSATSGGTITYEVIVGSFLYGGSKAKNKGETGQDSGQGNELDTVDTQSIPTSDTFSPSVMGGWSGSRQMDMSSAHINLDLTRG